MKFQHLALALGSVLMLAGCGGGSGGKGEPPANTVPDNVTVADPTANADAIAFNDMAVHDPSIIKANGAFYIFGSHLSVAKSTDLMAWARVAEGVDDANPLFNTFSSQIAEGIDWVGGYQGSWAADVIQLNDGKYYFYYNHCTNPATGNCDAPRSYIGVAVADNIEGPYADLGVFLRSGMNAAEIAAGKGPEGVGAYDGAVHPNVIDPHVFYDKEGKLWMVYGSYFGGIYILELDEGTAKPKAGQGYGTHLAGGGFAAIEGTWITYSPESDYYYMFNSIAGFAAADGYNIRVSRSRNPAGPYLDAAGNDMLNARNNTDTLSKYGVKLMGGFNFVSETGDVAEGWGYLSPGHNSVYYDANTKKYFLVTHTRFPNRGEEHSVRVHELFLNADNWFVASPQRYVPIEGMNVVDAIDLVGDYRFISHELDSNTTGHNSVYITLNEDRTITGEVRGYYRLSDSDNKRITLVLGSDTYEGVMAWQWDNAARKLVPTFTALSSKGAAAWGAQLEKRTTAQVFSAIDGAITLPAEITDSQLTVPLRGTRATRITWSSSNPAVINFKTDKKTGLQTGVAKVNRPGAEAGDQTLTLTATMDLRGQTYTKTLVVKVLALRVVPATAQYKFEGDLADANSAFAAGTPTGDRITNTGSVAYAAGWDGQALSLDGTNGVLLPNGLVSNYEYTVSFWIRPEVLTGFTTAFFGAVDTEQWLSLVPQGWNGGTMLWGRVPQWYDGITGMLIPQGEWSHVVFSINKGEANVYINGEKKHTGQNVGDLFSTAQGIFALGVNYWDIPFNGLIDDLKIYNRVLTPEDASVLDPGTKPPAEVLALAKEALGLGDISALKDDLDLPLAGPYTTSVSWKSAQPAVISDIGVVTQPGATEPDAQVTLVATISYGGLTDTREFIATVKSKAPPLPLATFSFEENLDEANHAVAPGVVVGTRVNEAGGQVSYIDGVLGKALVLDGRSGVVLPDNLINDHSYSISVWLNLAAGTQYTPAFFGWATDSSWISVVPRGPGDAQNTMLWSGTAWYDGTFNAKIPTAQWSHLVMTVDGGKLTTYLNGMQASSMAGFPDVFTPAGDTHFALGVNYWDSPYNGTIDELKIYDEVLSADDVMIIHAEGKVD